MSPYRTPDAARIQRQQSDAQFAYAGEAVVWKTYTSASAGIPAAGIGNSAIYVQRTITALFGPISQPEEQTPAGMFAAGMWACTTREKLGRSDELVWRGSSLKVDSDPTPARIAGTWMCTVKRGGR